MFAPKPRDYRISVPRKVRRLAMRSALTCKVSAAEMMVIDNLALTEAKTKNVVAMLKALGVEKKALIVTQDADQMMVRASNNIPGVKTTFVGSLNVVDILGYDKMIIAKNAAQQIEEVYAE